MECFYDSLYRVDCNAIQALASVACAYDINGYPAIRRSDGTWTAAAYYPYKPFQKKLTWILNCANVSMAHILHFDYLKGNHSSYFVEVHGIFIPKKVVWGYTTQSIVLQHYVCYFLGNFPNFWNMDNKKIVFAHNVMTDRFYQMEKTAVMFDEEALKSSLLLYKDYKIYGLPAKLYVSTEEKKEFKGLTDKYGKENMLNYLYLERMDAQAKEAFTTGLHSTYNEIEKEVTDLAFFYSKDQVKEFLMQDFALQERAERFANCYKQYYKYEVVTPQYKTQDPQGTKDFPGIPMDEMELPQPEAQPQKPSAPGQKIMKILLAFSVIEVSTLNGYSLILNVQELKF